MYVYVYSYACMYIYLSFEQTTWDSLEKQINLKFWLT